MRRNNLKEIERNSEKSIQKNNKGGIAARMSITMNNTTRCS